MNSVIAYVGEEPTSKGVATVTGPGSTWHSTSISVGESGPGTLYVQNGGLVDVTSIAVTAQGTVNLNGGTLRLDNPNAISGFDRINFNYGTVELTGDRTVGLDADIGGLFGAGPTIAVREALNVDGTATLATALTLDGGAFTASAIAGSAKLQLLHGTLNITNQALTVGPSGNLASSLDLASDMTVSSALGITNQGLVTGDGQIGGTFANAATGELRAEPGHSLTLTGANNTNAGRINLLGGELEFTQNLTNSFGGLVSGNGSLITHTGLLNQGTMNFGGTMNILGDVTNAAGGKIISAGGGATIFFDDVNNQGEIRTSTNGFSVFFGTVSGAGTFTGTGTVNFEGDLTPGNSPASVRFGGDVSFGADAALKIEISGSTPGSGYDQLVVSGDLALDGALSVTMLPGFTPAAGQSFN
ncbi:MAG TPA: hypothetical protein VHU84_15525, partial [Lacipirellulaceae bacterium]|nr:hypothetical protein [Lacipirellulaceae bacterium]